MLRPHAFGFAENQQTAQHVGGPAVARVGAQQHAGDLEIGVLVAGPEIAQTPFDNLRPRVLAGRRPNAQQFIVALLHGDAGGLGQRQLQHERTRVVREATKNVEAARGARHHYGPIRREVVRHGSVDQLKQVQAARAFVGQRGRSEVIQGRS